jgi:prolipoprotein diacylglyceryl transferase
MLLTSIPSPETGVWNLGPIPLRAYALLIIVGIIVAVWLGNKRYIARGGTPGTILDVAIWAVPFGIVGGRIYHVVTDWQLYFGANGSGLSGAIRIWDGGLGIWGAVAFGALGAWIGTRRLGIALPPVADAVAPGIALAQAIGRFGNYFNQELFGEPTDLPWGLEISLENRPAGFDEFITFHPTFLYESIWLVGVAVVVIWADRRFTLGHGRAFALYVLLYTLGRGWIEALRIDSANEILGLRLNIWTSIVVGLGALAYLIISARLRPGREILTGQQESVEATKSAESAESAGSTESTDQASHNGEPGR